MTYIANSNIFRSAKKIKKHLNRQLPIESLLNKIETLDDAKALLSCGRLINFSTTGLKDIINHIDKIPNSKELVIAANFLNWAFQCLRTEYASASTHLAESDIYRALEELENLLTRMSEFNISIDGKVYPSHVIESQQEHLISTLSSALFIFTKEGVPFRGKTNKTTSLKQFWNRASHYESLRSLIFEVENLTYSPLDIRAPSPAISALGLEHIIGKAKYYLGWSNPEWRNLEIYRDLNYQYDYHNEDDLETINSILKRSNAGSLNPKTNTLKLDFSKHEEFNNELKKYKIQQLLMPIYGSTDITLNYENVTFSLKTLICICLKIDRHAKNIQLENHERVKRGKKARIQTLTLPNILKITNIKRADSKILNLLACTPETSNAPLDLPLIKYSNEYIVLPSHITKLCYEKVIDKIISQEGVTIKSPQNIKKGQVFEEEVHKAFNEKNIKTIRTNGDTTKRTPEIDCIFEIDGKDLAICEVKCTIKPESRRDAYSFIENHLAPALEQLDTRYDFITTRPQESRAVGINTSNKNLHLIIITNHHYFSGLTAHTPKGRKAYVIDIRYLRLLLELKLPIWTFNDTKQNYLRSEKKIKISNIIQEMKKPSKNLLGAHKKSINIQETGIAIHIYSTPPIDERSYYQ